MRPLHLAFSAMLLLGAVTVPTHVGGSPTPQPSPRQATAMTGDEQDALCAACHDAQVESFVGHPHSVLGDPSRGASTGACGACHGDAEAHLDAGGGEGTIFAFGTDVAAPARTAVCQQCHAADHPRFQSSGHAGVGLTCTDCHDIHQDGAAAFHLLRAADGAAAAGPFSDVGVASASCAECHGEVFTAFEWNERHRLQEGILGCESCHDPHAPQAGFALGGFDEGCSECHIDKDGPFVFEHGSSIVEGCTACHSPHGSPNRHMLAFQDQGELCYSCHAAVPGFHVGDPSAPRFGLDANCTNCHSSIHGSNFDPAFLK